MATTTTMEHTQNVLEKNEPRQITWTTRTFDSIYGANATGAK